MLVIRFANAGRRGERKYKIVVSEKRSRKEGRPLELLGYYEKLSGGKIEKKINEERIKYWISQGAQLGHGAKKALELK